MSDDTLDIHIAGDYAGALHRAHDGSISFTYDAAYADDFEAPPLSLSMPKTRKTHSGEIPQRWITNLLPDDKLKRRELAEQYDLETDDSFTLLGAVGNDVAGAVQVSPEGVDPADDGERIEKTESEMAAAIAQVRADASAVPSHFGRWSLAGYQGKIAVAIEDGHYYAPSGAQPSTHILKFGPQGIEHGDLAEFITLRAAHYMGLPTARAELVAFGDQRAVAVERYDRDRDGTTVRRLHQEDLCQALGVASNDKYQKDGGPGVRDIATLLDSLPMEGSAVSEFIQQVMFNALTYSPDAHAKNYSILMTGTALALAPAYDLTSLIPVTDIKELRHKTHTAMKTGSSRYDADGFTPHRARRLAEDVGLDPLFVEAEASRLVSLVKPMFTLATLEAFDSLSDLQPHLLELMLTRIFEISEVLAQRFEAA